MTARVVGGALIVLKRIEFLPSSPENGGSLASVLCTPPEEVLPFTYDVRFAGVVSLGDAYTVALFLSR